MDRLLRIKVERTGGLTGITTSNEMKIEHLPADVANIVRNLMEHNVTTKTRTSIPQGAADHLNYKITIEDGRKNHVIERNEYDIDYKVKSLITYVERNSKKK